jgi:hypothetical protein
VGAALAAVRLSRNNMPGTRTLRGGAILEVEVQ